MMKRGISLVTSLMMTTSLVGGPAAQAFITCPVTLVSAAVTAPTLELVDTQVSAGVKKALVPVKVNAKDLAAMTVTISVKTKSGSGTATITDIKKAGYANISVGAENKKDEKGNSIRTFMWNALNSETDKPATINNEIIAYVEVSFDGATKDSVFQLDVIATDATILEDIKGQPVEKNFEKTGGWSSILNFGVAAAVEYKAEFEVDPAEYISAGRIVPVTLNLECPSDYAKLGVIAANFSASNGAKVVKVEGTRKGDGDTYAVSEKNKSSIVWSWEKAGSDADFNKSGAFATVYVEIPSDAVTGDKFTVSVEMDTATTDREEKYPNEYDKGITAELSVTNATLEIASPKVKPTDKNVSIPVMITTPNGIDAASLTTNFKVSAGDKKITIKSVTAGSQVAANEVQYSSETGNVLWVDAEGGKNVTLNGDMFYINVELPEKMGVGEKFHVTCGDAELVTFDRLTLGVDETDGDIIVVDPNVITDGYKITMKDVTKTPTADEVIVPVNVYLDGAEISAFDATFKVDNGAEIVSVEGSNISSGVKNPAHIYWQNASGTNTKFDGNTVFATVNVKIPAGLAKNRNSFTVSVNGEVDSVNADRISVLPSEPMGRGTIKFLEESVINPPAPEKHTTDIEIGSKEVAVDAEEKIVEIPVKATAKDLTALNGKFTLTKAADSETYTIDLVDADAAAKGAVESKLTVKTGTLSLTSEDYTVKTVDIVSVEDVTGETAAVVSKDGNVLAWLNADGKTFTADDNFLVVKVAVKAESNTVVTTTDNGAVTTPTETAVTTDDTVVTTTDNGAVTTPTETAVTTDDTVVTTTDDTVVTTTDNGAVTTPTETAVTTDDTVVTTTDNGAVTTPTETAVTTTDNGAVTTPTETAVTTTVTTEEPPVTTTTGNGGNITIEFGGDLKMPVDADDNSDVVKVQPESSFYFTYEDKFNLAGLVVKVDIYKDDEKVDTLDITDYIKVAEGVTPSSLAEEDGFKHNVELAIDVDKLDDENMMIIGNKKYDASDLIANFNDVYVPVLIGMRGDVNLDNEVDARDMVVITDECNNLMMDEDPYLTEEFIKSRFEDLTDEEVAEYLALAKFLGNARVDDSIDARDIAYISRFYNEVMFTDEEVTDEFVKDTWKAIEEN